MVSTNDGAPSTGGEGGVRLIGALSIAAGIAGFALLLGATAGAHATARTATPSATEQSLTGRLSGALARASAHVHEWRTGTPAGSAAPADVATTAQWVLVAGVLACLAFVVAGVVVRRRATGGRVRGLAPVTAHD